MPKGVNKKPTDNVELERKEVIDDSPKGLSAIVADELGYKYLRTKNGKDIQIKQSDRGYLSIEFKQGGQLPQEFQGKFTNMKFVTSIIQGYLAKDYAETESIQTQNN